MGFIKDLFNLHKGEQDKQKTLSDVKVNIAFTGANIWILACAVMVASVGLNVNSTAVIIGAMLISPLMGPIVGAGFALGIYDFELLKKSLLNLVVATVVSLLASTIYFFITPFKEAQSELLARTSPNIYDVLIAFFGGLVGVIAITRVEKGNPIPGVAIATALMPPLCTAGFGLATGNVKFFFGAMFLYGINCVFICISTFVIVKYLKYPAVKEIDVKHQTRVKYVVTGIIFLMLIPSAYFAYLLYREQHFKQGIETFIQKEFVENGHTIIYKKTTYSSSESTLELAFIKSKFSDNEINRLNNKLKLYGVYNTKLIVKQDSSDNLSMLKNDILNEVTKRELVIDEKDLKIQSLEKQIKESQFDSKEIFDEVSILFPEVNSLAIANQFYASTDTAYVLPTVLYQSNEELSEENVQKITDWLQKRMALNNLKVVNYKQ